MAGVYDRWHKSRPAAGEPVCADHKAAPSADHGLGDRWQARWRDGGRQRSRNFGRRADGERFLDRLDGTFCLVPKCGYSALVAALGHEVPRCDVTVDAVSLVIQWGAEQLWNWQPIGTAKLDS